MPDITLVTQSLGTEVTSIPEEFEVLSVESQTVMVVDVASPVTVVDVTVPMLLDVSINETTIDLQMSEILIELITDSLTIPINRLVSTDSGNVAVLGSDGGIFVPEEANVPLDVQVDEASATVTYVGQAEPGTATVDPAWRIKRITDSGGQISVDWADGSGAYVQVWDDRASLQYGP